MKKYTYQIDRRDSQGKDEGTDFIQAINLKTAIPEYCEKHFYLPYKISEKRVNRKIVATVTCPEETSGYIEIFRYPEQY